MASDEHPRLAGLTPEQRDAVTTQASPLCVIAGAGSGKTRVLTRRIAWQAAQGHADPRRVLAVTFTRRAARELRARLRRLGLHDAVRAGTFHAIALAQLRRHAADAGRRPPRILESPHQLMAKLRPKHDRAAVAEIIGEMGWARARLVTPERYAQAAQKARRRPPRGGAARFAQLYADYESAKGRRRVLDFDDVLGESLNLMAAEPKHAAAHRWLHQHLLVDEFQDINPLQFALLKSWLGPDSTLVVVGDPDQAIYGWNGADPDLINTVGKHFPGCAVLHLRTNFRSTPEVLAAAGRVLGRPPQPAVRPSGEEPTVTVCDDADEAAVLARAVRHRHRPGASWRRQAVLARTNAQLDPLRRALLRQGIPVATRGEGDLIGRPEIAAILATWPYDAGLALCVADTHQELRDPLNTDPAPASTAAAHNPDLASVRTAAAHDRGPAPARTARAHNPDPGPASIAAARGGAAAPDARANVETFLELAEDHLALDPDATVRSFRTALRAGGRPATSSDGVDLMTFHGAKGLEWPIVHLVGLEDGFVPVAHARSAAARAEERRLLHVAVTRAEQELHVLWCDRRDMGDKTVDRAPSPWLEAIAAPVAGLPDTVDAREAIARARKQLPERPAPDRA